MKITLKELQIRNFKGIKELKVLPNGKDLKIYGDNATGKTTIFDAYLWLLFGKNSEDKKDFEIKTLDSNGDPIHFLEHEVGADLLVDGKLKQLKRTYTEKWVKKTGTIEKVLTGHTTVYHIDGVPVSQKEYQSMIGEIIDEEVFKMVSNLNYFTSLHWTKQREILIELVGGIDNDEIVEGDKKLESFIAAILNQGKTIEDYGKMISEKKKKIKKDLEEIPSRVDETDRVINNTPEVSKSDAEKELVRMDKEYDEVKKSLSDVSTRNENNEHLIREVARKKQKLVSIESDHERNVEYKNSEVKRMIANYKTDIEESEERIKRNTKSKEAVTMEIEKVKEKLSIAREEYKEMKSRSFKPPTDLVCHTCGQELPIDQKEELINKARTKFMGDCSVELETISNKGTRLHKSIKGNEAVNDGLTKKNEIERDGIDDRRVRIMNTPDVVVTKFTPTDEYKEIELEIKAMEKAVDQSADTSLLVGKLSDISQKKDFFKDLLYKYEVIEKSNSRRSELLEIEKDLNEELLSIEKDEFMIDNYNNKSIDLLEKKLNSKFELVSFKLFNKLVNGALEPTCEALVEGVPYRTNLNNGARINAGLDIINTLIDFYGFNAPIFIDNNESVTKLIDTKSQIISLFVSEDDKELRVE